MRSVFGAPASGHFLNSAVLYLMLEELHGTQTTYLCKSLCQRLHDFIPCHVKVGWVRSGAGRKFQILMKLRLQFTPASGTAVAPRRWCGFVKCGGGVKRVALLKSV